MLMIIFKRFFKLKAAFQPKNNLLNFKFGPKGGGGTTWMTNWLVGDHQVAVVDVNEGVLEGSGMSGTLIIINLIVTKRS